MDNQGLVTKMVQVTDKNGTTFMRRQQVRAPQGDSGVQSKLTSPPLLTSSQENRTRAVEIANRLVSQLQDSYDFASYKDPIDLEHEDLQAYMKGHIMESNWANTFNEDESNAIDELEEKMLAQLSPEEAEQFTMGDGRIILTEEIMRRSDYRPAFNRALQIPQHSGFEAPTWFRISPSPVSTDKEALTEAGSLSSAIGLSPGDFRKNEEALVDFVKHNPGGEVRVFFWDRPDAFVEKWDRNDEHLYVSDPVLWCDNMEGTNYAVQLTDAQLSFNRENVSCIDMDLADGDGFSNMNSYAMIGGEPAHKGSIETGSVSLSYAHDSEPLF